MATIAAATAERFVSASAILDDGMHTSYRSDVQQSRRRSVTGVTEGGQPLLLDIGRAAST